MATSTKKRFTIASDYIPKLIELYPELSKKDILKIIKSFEFNFVELVRKDASILIFNNTARTEKYMFLYNGSGSYEMPKATNRIRRLLIKKIRIKFKQLKREWDGYYYFALNDEEFAKILSQKTKWAYSKKYYIFERVMLYKLFEECIVRSPGRKHIFRIPYVVEFGWSSWKDNFKCGDFEYIYRREKDGLDPVNISTRCDNGLFYRKRDLAMLPWVDKNLMNKKE